MTDREDEELMAGDAPAGIGISGVPEGADSTGQQTLLEAATGAGSALVDQGRIDPNDTDESGSEMGDPGTARSVDAGMATESGDALASGSGASGLSSSGDT